MEVGAVMAFTDEQRAALRAPLNPAIVKTKPTRGSPQYLPADVVMAAANRIFFEENWGYTVDRLERLEAPGGVMYSALVTITVAGCLPKQDVGTEIAAFTKEGDPPSALAHETAIKGAVTDGVKRALRSYGDQMGLQLYDKDANLGAEYAAWKQATDPRTVELRAQIEGYRQSDPDGVASVERKYGPSLDWDRSILEKSVAYLAGRAQEAARMPPVETAPAQPTPTSSTDTAPEPTRAEMLAGALDLARMGVERVGAKKGGPTTSDIDTLRTILSELQRLDPRPGETPAADVPPKMLVMSVAQRLPAPAAAGAPAADDDETQFS